MNVNRLLLIATLSPALALAAVQAPRAAPLPSDAGAAPAPPAIPGSPATHSGRVRTVVYGPQGEVQAITLRNGIAVSLLPDLAMHAQGNLTRGAHIQVSGMQRVIAGQISLIAQSLRANGETFVAASPATGPAFAGGAPPPPPARPRDNRGQAAPPPPASVGPVTPPPPPPPATVAAPPPPPQG